MRNLTIGMLLCLTGCSLPANPHTEITYGTFGFRLHNSKDVTVKVKNAKFDPKTGEFTVDELEFDDNASNVRRANVEQIQAYTEQVKAVSQVAIETANMIRSIVPYLPRPPGGSLSIGTSGVGVTVEPQPVVLPPEPVAGEQWNQTPPTSQPSTQSKPATKPGGVG